MDILELSQYCDKNRYLMFAPLELYSDQYNYHVISCRIDATADKDDLDDFLQGLYVIVSRMLETEPTTSKASLEIIKPSSDMTSEDVHHIITFEKNQASGLVSHTYHNIDMVH